MFCAARIYSNLTISLHNKTGSMPVAFSLDILLSFFARSLLEDLFLLLLPFFSCFNA